MDVRRSKVSRLALDDSTLLFSLLFPSRQSAVLSWFVDFAGDRALTAAELCNLLSPLHPAASKHLSPSSLGKYNSPAKLEKSLVRANSPICGALEFNAGLDTAAFFKNTNQSPPRGSPLTVVHRSPLSPLENLQRLERRNTKSPLRPFRSRCLIVD